MNLLLVCASGMSTGLLVRIMSEEAQKQNLGEMDILACSVDEIEQHIDHYDVVLVAPQIRYKERQLASLAASRNKACAVIDGVSYGRVDGKRVLDQAFSLMKK